MWRDCKKRVEKWQTLFSSLLCDYFFKATQSYAHGMIDFPEQHAVHSPDFFSADMFSFVMRISIFSSA